VNFLLLHSFVLWLRFTPHEKHQHLFLLVMLITAYSVFRNGRLLFKQSNLELIEKSNLLALHAELQPRSSSERVTVTTTTQETVTPSNKSDDGCTIFGVALQSQSQGYIYEQSTKLPKWMKGTMDWDLTVTAFGFHRAIKFVE
jgi:hypothetical protein